MEFLKRPLVILTGPTAVGKTALSIELAKVINGEIISADSMQVYRHMDIGSAKITAEEMAGVPHHLIDVMEPTEAFNVVIFQKLAKAAMEEIYGRGRIPVLVGGTGFYIQAVLYDIDFTENDEDPSLRRELEELAGREGPEVLYEKLKSVDPAACESIHAHNVKRVIRALEFFEKTGQQISGHNEVQKQNAPPYRYAYFVLNDKREEIYRRIDARVDRMMAEGLMDEVLALKEMGCTKDMVSMQGLGYKEILRCLEGEISMEEAVYLIKRDTRHFAKRQMTWFRREKDVIWLDKTDIDQNGQYTISRMQEILREKTIIL